MIKVDPATLGTELVCPKCHVILRLAKDDGEPNSLFDLRRLLRRRKVAVGLACAVAVLLAFIVGLNLGSNRTPANGNNRGIVQTAFGLFVAHNEVHIEDGAKVPPKPEK
jgi:hypothetical protein